MIELNSKIKNALIKIDFIKRYEELSNKFNAERTPSSNRLVYIEGKEVMETIQALGYSPLFDAKEKLYKIKEEQIGKITLGVHIILQDGMVDLVWVVRENGELPDELIKIWEDNGLARLMGGYLKVVNPEDYQELLKETYFRGNISVPILVTAFGDIVTFEEGQYIGMVKYKNGNFAMLAKNFKRFIQNLGDDYFLEKYFQIPQYIEAVNKLGKLEQDECFGYVPLLGLGGSEKIQNLKKVKIREYIELISQLVGKIGM